MSWLDPDPRAAALRGRLLAWLCIAVFALQCALARHDHHDAAKARHCVCCALHAQPHAAPPPAIATAAHVHWHVAYWSLPPGCADADVAPVPYLIPPAHAPPRFP